MNLIIGYLYFYTLFHRKATDSNMLDSQLRPHKCALFVFPPLSLPPLSLPPFLLSLYLPSSIYSSLLHPAFLPTFLLHLLSLFLIPFLSTLRCSPRMETHLCVKVFLHINCTLTVIVFRVNFDVYFRKQKRVI